MGQIFPHLVEVSVNDYETKQGLQDLFDELKYLIWRLLDVMHALML